jgi:hypothetical protein
MRIGSWLFLLAGAACLAAAAVLGVSAARQAAEIAAYQHARPCAATAAADAGCLRTVTGSVAGVTEYPGGYRIPPDYELYVRTGAKTLRLSFASDSPLLGYAADGDPAVVTLWRGVPVSVTTNGRSAVTAAVPRTAFTHDAESSEQAVAVGVFVLLAGLALRAKRRGGQLRSPALGAALLLAGLIAEAGALALDGKSSRVWPDIVATGFGLAVALGFGLSVGVSLLRHSRQAATAGPHLAGDVPQPAVPAAGYRRSRPAIRARVLVRGAVTFIPVLLTVGVFFGVLFTLHDGPAARGYRHAPACVAESNLATCAGDFTAVINGVRSPGNGVDFAEVSYVTEDGAINAWAQFDGDTAVTVRAARAAQLAETPLRIRAWRGAIVGAELGGSWHWADGNPPGNTDATLLLAISFALLLLLVRLRVHRRVYPAASGPPLIADDLGQVAVAAGGIVLLAQGYWPGVILAVAALAWLGLSVRDSSRRGVRRFAAARP